MDDLDRLMATVCIKGNEKMQVSIEELADYLFKNADKIETRHQQMAWFMQKNSR